MADWANEFIRTLQGMSGRYSSYQVFSDWVESAAIAYRNSCHPIHDGEWQRWEDQYMSIVSRYEHDELCRFGYLIACTARALEDEMEDFLGRVFMEAGLADKGNGQFFTPFEVSMATARLSIDMDSLPGEGRIRLHEPSCGAGGMVIAACRVLHEAGIDYQRRLDVIAQDLDWRAGYMTYLQQSLLGCRAVVAQGDTLTDPYHVGYPRERCMETPAMMGLIV